MSNDERGDPPHDGMDDDSTVPIGARLRQLMEISKVADVEDGSDATVQVDLAELMARGGLDSTPAMDVSVALDSGPQEAASVGHVATKQMDVATLAAGFAEMNAGKAAPEAEPEPALEAEVEAERELGGPAVSIVRQETLTNPRAFPAPAQLPPPSTEPRAEPQRPIERVTARVDMAEVARLLTEAAQREKEAAADTDTGIKDLSHLAGNIVANVERRDPTLDVTIRGDMESLLSGVMDFVHSDRVGALDAETRAAMEEFAAELAGELAGELEAEALGRAPAAVRPRRPLKTVVEPAPTVRGSIPDAVSDLIELSGLQEIHDDVEEPPRTFEELQVPGTEEDVEPEPEPEEVIAPPDDMATIQVDASQLPVAVRLAPIPGATELRPMQPDPAPTPPAVPAVPAAPEPAALAPAAELPPSEAQPLDLDSLEQRAQELDAARAANAAAADKPVRLAKTRRSGSKKYLFATLLLLLLIGVLTAVAGYLAWRGGHLMFLEKMLGS
jgi:hypothetical protein